MTKLEALKVLIEHSFFLSEQAKKELLLKIYSFNEEQIETIGKFLAEEKKKAMENNKKDIQTYDKIIKYLEKDIEIK